MPGSTCCTPLPLEPERRAMGPCSGSASREASTLVDRLETPVDALLDAIGNADETSAPSLRLSPECSGYRARVTACWRERLAAGEVVAARQAAADFRARYGDETGMAEANVPLFAVTDAMLSGDWEEWQSGSPDSVTTTSSSAASPPTCSPANWWQHGFRVAWATRRR